MLTIYHSRVHKYPDFENNQGFSSHSKLIINEPSGDPFFSFDYLYIGLFSATGGSFNVTVSFKTEITWR